MPSKRLDHRSELETVIRKSSSKPPDPIQSSNHEKNNRQALPKTNGARMTTKSSKAAKHSDIDDLTSAFGNLSSNDPRFDKSIVPEKQQPRPKWNHETRAATLNTHQINIPPPKRRMFFNDNPRANIYQKQTIARLYHDEREVQIELANPPDPKTLINPADLMEKVDPKIQAKRDAFTAESEEAYKKAVERGEDARRLRMTKSTESLRKRNEALRRTTHQV